MLPNSGFAGTGDAGEQREFTPLPHPRQQQQEIQELCEMTGKERERE